MMITAVERVECLYLVILSITIEGRNGNKGQDKSTTFALQPPIIIVMMEREGVGHEARQHSPSGNWIPHHNLLKTM